jgi:hypothetical protein
MSSGLVRYELTWCRVRRWLREPFFHSGTRVDVLANLRTTVPFSSCVGKNSGIDM